MSLLASGRLELLVSIRSMDEWHQLANVHFGKHDGNVGERPCRCPFVDIIDLKEPQKGPLAPVAPELMEHVARQCLLHERLQLSVALGESDVASSVASTVPPTVQFAKMGISGIRSPEELTDHWGQIVARLPRRTELVAVAYADHQTANCLSALEVLDTAMAFGLQRILIDTYKKDGRSSLHALSTESLQRFAANAEERLWWALAGSLNEESLGQLDELGIKPDCLGVRGQVCHQGRESNLSIDRCWLWRDAVSRWELNSNKQTSLPYRLKS